MKTTSFYIFLCCWLCLAVSSNAGLNPFITKYATFDDAKAAFTKKGLHKRSLAGAKKWFRWRDRGEEFETYHEARDFLETKGWLKDANPDTSFARKNDPGDPVDDGAFHDVMVSLYLSQFVYYCAQLRKKVKTLGLSETKITKEILDEPSFKNINGPGQGPMKRFLMGKADEGIAIDMQQIQDVLKYKGFKEESKNFAEELIVTAIHSFKKNKLFIHYFDAEFNEKNLVYCIASRQRDGNDDNGKKDVFLAFRGSITTNDWLYNFQTGMVTLALRHDKNSKEYYMVEQASYNEIPIEKDLYYTLQDITDNGKLPIRVHTGFTAYLFAKRDGDDSPAMYANIRRYVEEVLTKKGAKSLHVTGHSLGAGLATLAAFFLSCDKNINNRSKDWEGIKLITFASPYVGNISFQRAVEAIQSKKKYQSSKVTDKGQRIFQHIRIINNRDIVPLINGLSVYRHASAIRVYLNRRQPWSWRNPLGMYKVVPPKIMLDRAHWRAELPWKVNWWRMFHPTSMAAGYFGTTLRLVMQLVTAAPFILLLPFLLVRLFWGLFPTSEQYYLLGEEILKLKESGKFYSAPFKWYWNVYKFFEKENWARYTALALPSSICFGMFFFPLNIGYKTRVLWLTMGLPIITSFLNKAWNGWEPYHEWAKIRPAAFIILLLVLQIGAFFRRSFEVYTFKVHSPGNYYNHLRPHHKKLSTSKAIVDRVNMNNMKDDKYGETWF